MIKYGIIGVVSIVVCIVLFLVIYLISKNRAKKRILPEQQVAVSVPAIPKTQTMSTKVSSELGQNVSDCKLNATLSKILSHGFTDTSIIHTSNTMIGILKEYYGVRYVTLFTYTKQGWFNIIATNIANDRVADTEKFYNQQAKGMNTSSKVLIVEGYNPENFISRNGLEYSNFTLLYHENKIIGAVALEHTKRADIEDRETAIYDMLFNATALVLNHLIEVSELVAMVSTDQLTGVYNRRFIDITLQEEVEKHMNLGQTFNVALMDIDHFKKFNDTYGHQFGDIVLQEVSKYIKEQLGKHSWVARYGGEEFLVFCARSETDKFYTKIDAIREGISNLVVTYNGDASKVTVSFGISSFPQTAKSVKDVIAKADTALYQSKETGRNKVTIYSE